MIHHNEKFWGEFISAQSEAFRGLLPCAESYWLTYKSDVLIARVWERVNPQKSFKTEVWQQCDRNSHSPPSPRQLWLWSSAAAMLPPALWGAISITKALMPTSPAAFQVMSPLLSSSERKHICGFSPTFHFCLTLKEKRTQQFCD